MNMGIIHLIFIYRVVATSLLPISENTLIYGSEDAGTSQINKEYLNWIGISIHAEIPEFNDKMKQIAFILNLKPHFIKNHSHVKLYLAAVSKIYLFGGKKN